jgi:hypothetical protein
MFQPASAKKERVNRLRLRTARTGRRALTVLKAWSRAWGLGLIFSRFSDFFKGSCAGLRKSGPALRRFLVLSEVTTYLTHLVIYM